MQLFIKSQQDGLSLVEIVGDVSQRHLTADDDPLQDLLGDGCYSSRVLLDLHGIEAVDSSGIGWLLACQKKFRTQGGLLVLHSLSSAVRDVMKILNMQLVFKMAEDEAAARRMAEASTA